MAKLNAGATELKVAYKIHSKLAGESTSHYLILFYCVECGLKYLHASSLFNMRPKSFALDDSLETHKLQFLLDELKPPKHLFAAIQKIFSNKSSVLSHTIRNKNEIVDIENIHQAWRYGIKLIPEEEERIVEWLKIVSKFIAEKMNQ